MTAASPAGAQPRPCAGGVRGRADLSYQLRTGRQCQRHLVRCGEGEFVTVVGPSGCGKSSLLKLILGLERATRGSLAVDGREIAGPSRGVGAVFQAPVLLPWRTIEENVLLPADVMKLDRHEATERARALLKMAGLDDSGSKYPYELSGGMQHRASIVRALVHDPKLLIMDEPFAALDAITREQMATELQRILDGQPQDRDVHHPFDQRGGVPLGPHRRDVGAARPHHCRVRQSGSAPAQLRRPDVTGVGRVVRRDPAKPRPRLRRIDDRATRMADITTTEPQAVEAQSPSRVRAAMWRILERLLSLTILLLIIEGGIPLLKTRAALCFSFAFGDSG